MQTNRSTYFVTTNPQDLLILKNATILDAIKQMDRIGRKLLIVAEGNTFISLLSIGDIQRAILSLGGIDGIVGDILRSDVRVAHINDDRVGIKREMMAHRMEFMPIINDEAQLEEVIFWEDVFQHDQQKEKTLDNIPVVVMAGGKGTRLKPITNIIPKPLVPLGDFPILQHIMDGFHDYGVREFYVSVNYKAEMIANYFEELDPAYGISYIKESKPLGTAGSLSLLKDKISTTFFVSNCDILIDEDLGEIYDYHKSNGNLMTATAAIKHIDFPYGTMEIGKDGLLNSMTEKPQLNFFVNAGLYILEPQLIKLIPENQVFHMTDLMELLINQKQRVGVFPVSEGSWWDIGVWREYDRTLKRHGR